MLLRQHFKEQQQYRQWIDAEGRNDLASSGGDGTPLSSPSLIKMLEALLGAPLRDDWPDVAFADTVDETRALLSSSTAVTTTATTTTTTYRRAVEVRLGVATVLLSRGSLAYRIAEKLRRFRDAHARLHAMMHAGSAALVTPDALLLTPRATPYYEPNDVRMMDEQLVFSQHVRERPIETVRRILGTVLSRMDGADMSGATSASGTLTRLRRALRAIVVRYGAPVLAPLATTEAWLSTADSGADEAPLLESVFGEATEPLDHDALGPFVVALRDVPSAFWARLPPRFWRAMPDYATLTAVLLRVRVLEEVHALVSRGLGSDVLSDDESTALRIALRLARNSHIDMMAFFVSDDGAVGGGGGGGGGDGDGDCSESRMTRAALARPTSGGSPLSWRDALDPLLGERALGEGDAPRFASAYEFVDFFSECGLGANEFSHMRLKLAPRCCGCREYDRLQDRACAENEAYYHLTVLDLELGITGGYAHAFEAPSFWRTLCAVGPLRCRCVCIYVFSCGLQCSRLCSDVAATKKQLLAFQTAYPHVATLCSAEAMVRAIGDAPHLRAMLCETYPAWREFEATTRFEMDIVRRVYSRTGSLVAAAAAVERDSMRDEYAAAASSSSSASASAAASTSSAAETLRFEPLRVYRHRQYDFVTALTRYFAEEDRRRFAASLVPRNRTMMTAAAAASASASASDATASALESASDALTRNDTFLIDRYVETLDPLAPVSLRVLAHWRASAHGIAVLEAIAQYFLPEAHSHADDIRREMATLSKRDYDVAAYFFARLQRHNAVRVTRFAMPSAGAVRRLQIARVREACGGGWTGPKARNRGCQNVSARVL